MSEARTLMWLMLTLTALATSSTACNVTLSPTSTLGFDVTNAIESAPPNPEPFLICLLPGTYTGCYNLTLATPSGAPARISGAGSTLTSIDCSADEFGLFAIAPVADTWLQGFKLSGCGDPEFSIPIGRRSYDEDDVDLDRFSPANTRAMIDAFVDRYSGGARDTRGGPSSYIVSDPYEVLGAANTGVFLSLSGAAYANDLDLSECSCDVTLAFLNDSDATVSNVTIGGGSGDPIGATIIGFQSRILLHQLSVTKVFATSAAPVYCFDSDVDVIDCSFHNTFGFYSGGIVLVDVLANPFFILIYYGYFQEQPTVTSYVTNSTFSESIGLYGAAIYVSTSGIEVSGCTFSDTVNFFLFGRRRGIGFFTAGGAVGTIASTHVSRHNTFVNGFAPACSSGIGGVISNITSEGDLFVNMTGVDGFFSGAAVATGVGSLSVVGGVFVNCTNRGDEGYSPGAVYAGGMLDLVVEGCEFVGTTGGPFSTSTIYVEDSFRTNISNSVFVRNNGALFNFALSVVELVRCRDIEMDSNLFVNNSNVYATIEVGIYSVHIDITNTTMMDEVGPGISVDAAVANGTHVQGLAVINGSPSPFTSSNILYFERSGHTNVSDVYIRDSYTNEELMIFEGSDGGGRSARGECARGGCCLRGGCCARGGCPSYPVSPMAVYMRDITIVYTDLSYDNLCIYVYGTPLDIQQATFENYGDVAIVMDEADLTASDFNAVGGYAGLVLLDGFYELNNITMSNISGVAIVASGIIEVADFTLSDSVMDDVSIDLTFASLILNRATISRVTCDSLVNGDTATAAVLHDITLAEVNSANQLLVGGCAQAVIDKVTVADSGATDLVKTASASNVILYDLHVSAVSLSGSGVVADAAGVDVVFDNFTFTDVVCGSTVLAVPSGSQISSNNATFSGGSYIDIYKVTGSSLYISNITSTNVQTTYLLRGAGFLSGSIVNVTSTGSTGTITLGNCAIAVRDILAVFSSSTPADSFLLFTDSAIIDLARVTVDGGSLVQPLRASGGMYLVARDIVLTSGYTSGDGGGISCSAGADCTFTNVDITECVAGGIGGALACDSTTGCVLQDSLLANCSALSGGAIGLSGADGSSFSNVVIASSSANTNGGGLEVSSSDSVTLDSVTLRDCSATSGGGLSASAQGTSVTANDVVFDGNYASATGAAIMCLSEAAVSVANSQITDNWGSPAVYALFQATVAASDVVFTGNGDCVSAFGANNMTLDRVSLSSNTGTAIQSVSSPLYVTDSVIRDNSGAMAVRLASVLDAVFTRSYVAANAGVGLTCVTPKPNSAVVFDDSALCDNSPDWACDSDCNVVGVAGACTAANVTSCGDYCAATPEFCVRDGGVFVGPYDGCFACDGACYADEFNCTDNAECVDGASGSYECTCQSGFVGNGSVACVDIDECADGTDNCAVEAVCTNTPGSFDCACNSGYEGNGVVCTDVDECVNEAGNGTLCAGGAVCRNIVGGYECECDDRSYGDGYSVCNACPANTESFVGARNVSDCRCVAGFYDVEGHEGSGCIPCPRGYYVLFAGDEFVCIECPPDTYSTAVNTAGTCASCPAATTTNGVSGATSVNNCTCALGLTLVTTANVTQCERLCRVGEYRPTPTAPCYACAPGTYSGVLNAESCESCPRNSDSTVSGATTSANCTCNTGYFAPGGTTDEDCERWCGPGWARPDPFAIDCVACDSGEYSDSANQAACSACPENSVSDPLSTEIEDCSCPSGYYTPAQKTGTACLVCPTGATCAGGVAVPLARKGYTEVETGDDTAAFAECVPFEACEAKGECAEGYAGDQCQQCAARYYRLDGLCYKCKTNAGIIVFFCFFALLVFCAILVVFNSQERVLNKFASVVIGVNAFQIAAMYGRLDLDWPPLAQKFFSFLSFVNFNIELVSPECAVSVTDPFVLRWLMTMLFPAVVALMFAIIYAVGSLLMKLDCGLSHYEFSSNRLVAAVMDVDWSPRHLSHTCIRAFYQIMTIGYLPLSATVFEFFYCVRDLNGNKVISTSRQTACYTKTYWSLFPFALIWMFLYPIGIPLFCGFLLQTKRARLGIIKFNIRYGFLVGRFSEEYFYYELAVMGRKLGVALCMSFLTPNPYIRAGGAIVVLLVAYSAQLGLTPYRSNLYNWMENGCLFCSVAVLLISVVFQAHGAAEVTREVLVVGVLCAMLVIIAVGLGTDIIRMVREEREIEEQVGLERRFESSGSSAAQEGYMGSDGSHHVLQTAVISTDNAVWALDGSDASVIAAGVATTSGGGFSSGETSGADGTSGSRGGGGGSGGGVGGGMGVGTPDGPMSLLGASVGGESSYALESYPAILASGGSELGGGGVGSGGVGSLQSSGSEVSSDVNALVRQPTPQLALPPPLPDVTPASPTTAGSAAPQPSQQHLAMPPAKPPTTPRGAKPPPKVPRPAKAVPSKPPRPSPGSGGGGGSMVASELASLPLPDESMLSDLSSTPLA